MTKQKADKEWKTGFQIILTLIIITLAVYWRAGTNGFLNLDDPSYVTENVHVTSGLTLDSVRWAFTSTEEGNWHPVTWLSHMLDCQVFGLNPQGHHLTNVFLHIANAVLLFLLLAGITGRPWQGAAVAALFALHPLHVESVAWVSERKDVLSTFFFLATLMAYARYIKQPGLLPYIPLVLLYALGLMSKPMLVTLPFVLVLLDFWPLGRIQKGNITSVLIEKIPLFILSAIICIITYLAQEGIGALLAVQEYPFALRVMNAAVSYVTYIIKIVWPRNLAVLYPLPAQVLFGQVAGSLALLAAVTAAVIWRARRYPFALVGWLWFLGTLVPVIGLVQMGRQAMADRYTYIPSIGIFVLIVWGVSEWSRHWQYRRIGLATGGILVLAMAAVMTWLQLGYWHDTVSLYEHALGVTRNNYFVHTNLGIYYLKAGQNEKAIGEFRDAVRVNPGNYYPHRLLADALSASGRVDEAIGQYEEGLRIKPDDPEAHQNLGALLKDQGKKAAAFFHISTALRLDPNNGDAHFIYGSMLESDGRLQEAVVHYSDALRINPADAESRIRLNNALNKINSAK